MRRRASKECAQPSVTERQFSAGWFYGTIAAGSVGMAMTAPITALYAKALGASDGLAALIVSSMAVSLLAIDLVASRVVPRLDARTALIGGYLVFGVGSFASAVAPNLAIMTAARILQGFAIAFPQGAGFHMALRLAKPGQSGREIGKFNSSAFVGLAVGPLIVGAVASISGGITGMRWGFAVCGVVNVATAIIARVALPSIPSSQRPEFGFPHKAAFRGSRTRLAMLAAGMGFGLRGVIGMTLLPLLGDDIGAGVSGVALATMFMSVSELSGIMASGRLSDRYGRRPVVVTASLLSTIGLLSILAGPSLLMYFVLSAALGVVMAALRVVPAAMIADVAESDEAAAMGWRLSSDVSSLTMAVVVGSVLSVAGIYGGFAYAAGMALLIGFVALVLGETKATSLSCGAGSAGVASTVVPPGVPLAEACEEPQPCRHPAPRPAGLRVVPAPLPLQNGIGRPAPGRTGLDRLDSDDDRVVG